MVLSDQQPFDFSYGMNAVLMEAPNDEQWFEPAIGMKAVDIEIDFVTPRGYIIRK